MSALFERGACAPGTLPGVLGANGTERRRRPRGREPRYHPLGDRISVDQSRVVVALRNPELDPWIVTLPLNPLLLQNNLNLRLSVSVEVGVREFRQAQKQPVPACHTACFHTSAYQPEFDFRLRLWHLVFAFLRVNFSRTRSWVAFP
jgi:hypothetical protein